MNDCPVITIALTTCYLKEHAGARWVVARQAVPTWRNLMYSGSMQMLWVDDGSDDMEACGRMAALLDTMPWPWKLISHERQGLGISLNRIFAEAPGPVLYAADDWELRLPQNLDPWMKLLDPRWNVSVVRLGMLHPGVTGSMEQGPGCWFLRLEPHNVVCGIFRPSLISKGFFELYGPFPKFLSPLAVEYEMNNERYCPMQRQHPDLPGIVLGLTEPWQHLESRSFSE